MKYREVLLEQLKPLPFFKKEDLAVLSGHYAIKTATVDSYISRSLARKDIVQFRRGIYTSSEFYKKNVGDAAFAFFLANVLRTPSYISSWTALQYYDLTTEAINTVISVTPKVTRTYQNKMGSFVYQSIKKELFSGFVLVKGTFDFFIATPPKALFDLLYFKTNQFRGISFDMVDDIVSELRIDFDEMSKEDKSIFYGMIKQYLHPYGK